MLTKEKIKEILFSRIEEISSLQIPHFSLLDDVDKASKRIKKAIENNEKIVIVGDYDVDGVSSSAVMYIFFKKFYNNFEIKIPNRFKDGYGLTPKLLANIEADLIITVDNGITSFEAAEICKERKIDLIITDHHTPKKLPSDEFQLPSAYAIINPKTSPDFPFKEICGAEVAWYLCAGIKSELKLDIDLREFLDIVAIAIIADVMPLQHMNRVLVNMGLKRLNTPKRAFSKVLKNYIKTSIKASDIAFNIAPKLNAAGRVENAFKAFKFLVSENYEEALRLYIELDRLNSLRKEIEKEILDDIKEINDDFIVVKGNYHEGVIGIIASRLVHKYKKPAIVFSENKDKLKGSGRSLGNIDIFSMINECKEELEKFGGHKMACGLSIKEENFEKLKDKLNEKIKKYKKEDFFIDDFVLGEIEFSEIDEELLKIIESFEPYGEGNPKPKFISFAKIVEIRNLKDNHFRLLLSQKNITLPAVIFNYNQKFPKEIKFKFTIERDFYSNLQLIIEEII